MVERTEEQALIHAVAADVEGRVNVLLRQLEDANHRGVGKFSSLSFPSFLLLHLFSNCAWNLVCAIDAFLDYLGVTLGTREDRLWLRAIVLPPPSRAASVVAPRFPWLWRSCRWG
jgi:hypothetical protein